MAGAIQAHRNQSNQIKPFKVGEAKTWRIGQIAWQEKVYRNQNLVRQVDFSKRTQFKNPAKALWLLALGWKTGQNGRTKDRRNRTHFEHTQAVMDEEGTKMDRI